MPPSARLGLSHRSLGRAPALLADVLAGARLLARLPGFLRRPIGADQARQELTRRLEGRDATFLDLVRRTVYGRPASPYARLLRHAGCERGDLERLVRADGVEGALRTLLAAGVYLTAEELRGHRPARRGALVIEVDPLGLRNPLDEAANGGRSLRLLVHPGVGPVDPHAVAEAFVSVLDRWPARSPLTVERRVPLATKVGKVLHVHRTRAGSNAPRD